MHTNTRNHLALGIAVIAFVGLVLGATAVLSVASLRAFVFGADQSAATNVLRADFPSLP